MEASGSALESRDDCAFNALGAAFNALASYDRSSCEADARKGMTDFTKFVLRDCVAEFIRLGGSVCLKFGGRKRGIE